MQDALDLALLETPLAEESEAFARRLVFAAIRERGRWNDLIAPRLARNWSMERLARADRTALFLAVAELWTEEEIPPVSTISEWVAVAERHGAATSARFVHGVLAALLPRSPKSGRSDEEAELDEAEHEADEIDEIMIEGDLDSNPEAASAKGWLRKFGPGGSTEST